ncbi:MAG: bifunctional riboflavin kinase/FAD synthetase [Firmicutes bacterium]|jgi:riboflavin kinase/FMN adenylyltransferase|nr:bifunctional riboflavin kinase/FAD synthetase [Bacillota bacterium]
MQIVFGLDNLPSACRENIFLALGNFDGVHKGHQHVIRTAVEAARSCGGNSAALIFDPHPAHVVRPEGNLLLLSDLEAKGEILGALGLDYMIVEPFSEETSRFLPEEFVKIYLKGKIGVRGVIAGFDYTFGRGAAGNISHLKEWGDILDIDVRICSPVNVEGKQVSSSAIRELIVAGKVRQACKLLNYHYFRHGKVVPGAGRGKDLLGFPTANVSFDPSMVLPGKGVYCTIVKLDGQLFVGAANIGVRPTFPDQDLAVEINIVDYHGDLYGQILTVYFIDKIRDEIAFSSADELKMQIAADIETIRRKAEGSLPLLLPGGYKYGVTK